MKKFNDVESCSELFAPNTWYGSAKILKDYARWPFPLPFVVPHAAGHSSVKIWSLELESVLPSIYCFPAYRKRMIQKKTDKKIILGASPWIYLCRMKKETQEKKEKRKGSIVFPPHSTHLTTTKMNDLKYVKYLKKLPDYMKPIHVCMYWRDIELNRHNHYNKSGFKVVCAGHLFNEKFLENFYNIIKNKKYALTNAYGSHIFYASSAGLKVLFRKQVSYEISGTEEVLRRDCARDDLSILSKIDKIFLNNENTVLQKTFSDSILGAHYSKTSQGLLFQIIIASLSNGILLKILKKNKQRNYQ